MVISFKGGGGTSADSFPKVSKILYMEQMVLPGEIEGYFFFFGQLNPNPMCIFHKKNDFFLFGLHGERRQWGLERVHQEVDQYFFCHVIHHFYLFFEGKSNENGFRNLRDLLATMVDVDNEV